MSAFNSGTGDTVWTSSFVPIAQPCLFTLEITDLYHIRLIPQNDLARSIAKAWGERQCSMTQEFKGRGPENDLLAAEALQAVVFRMDPVAALTSSLGPNWTRRLSSDQYAKCLDAITPKAKAVTANKVPPRPRKPAKKHVSRV